MPLKLASHVSVIVNACGGGVQQQEPFELADFHLLTGT